MQQGTYVGQLIARRVAGHAVPRPFHYRNKGNLATIGRAFAIADLGWLRLSGGLGWLLWLTVHLYYLTNLWDRIQVFATWAWAYVTYERSARVLSPVSLERAGRAALNQPGHGTVPDAVEVTDETDSSEEQGSVD